MEKKRDFIWNSLAGIINASEAVLMSMIITRVTGLRDAGILTVAFAVGNLLMAVGKFGVRNYQVTDTDNSFSFCTYFLVRVITVWGMAFLALIYSLKVYYSVPSKSGKALSIAAICAIYCVEAFEDVFWGEFQKRGRLDIGAKFFCVRWTSIIIVFSIMISYTKNLSAALWGGCTVSLIILCVLLYVSFGRFKFAMKGSHFNKKEGHHEKMSLLKDAFPLFAVSFLSFYLNNAPKYSIDAIMSEEAQACYGFVAMPVFVIGLLNSFIYQPSLVGLAIDWANDARKFLKRVFLQCLIIAVISVICMVGASIIGIPVLSIVYNTDLDGYWNELIILQGAGFFLALSGYMAVVLTIMRYQKSLMWGYILVSVVEFAIMNVAVKSAGTVGAAIVYLICMSLLSLIYTVMFIVYYRKNSGNKKRGMT